MEDNLTEFEDVKKVPFLKRGDNLYKLIIIALFTAICGMQINMHNSFLACLMGVNLGMELSIFLYNNKKKL